MCFQIIYIYDNAFQNLTASSVCWGTVGEEAVVVTVGSSGRLVVWQAKHDVTRVFTLSQMSDLSVVETNPKNPSQALVAADKNIALVSLKGKYTSTGIVCSRSIHVVAMNDRHSLNKRFQS